MGSPAKPANGVHPALQEYARDVASLVLDSEGNTPLHIVVTKGRLTTVDKLRASVAMGIKVDVQNRQGVTPLMLAAARGKYEAVRELLRLGADVHKTDGEGSTCLHYAARRDDAIVAKALLAAGAEPERRGASGRTALHVAAWGGHIETVLLLLASGSSPQTLTDWKRNPMHLAASKGHAAVLNCLIYSAGAAGSPEVRACLDQQDWEGRTPLSLAASWGHVAAVQVLLSAGSYVGSRDASGETALHQAMRGWEERRAEEYIQVVAALLDARADPAAASTEGVTPQALAAASGSAQLQQLLSAAMERSRSSLAGLSGIPHQLRSAFGAPGTSSSRSSQELEEERGAKHLMCRSWLLNFEELTLIKLIGEGSFGRVYLAKWKETLVAAKILLNTGVDVDDDSPKQVLNLSNPLLLNLQKEAEVMAALRHPHCLSFLGVCTVPPCVVTEYCSRGSLADVLRTARQQPSLAAQLDWVRRINMMLDAAKGMLYLHARNPPVIHRDLKSPNLLVDKQWGIKVCDFNLSKILMEDASLMSSSHAMNPRWLAPEVLMGQPATFQSDYYSFGVVCWELLTWQIPFANSNPWQIVRLKTSGGQLEIPQREDLPGPGSGDFVGLDAYIGLILKCCTHDPQERPTFQEVIRTLRELLAMALEQQGKERAAAVRSQPST